MNIKKKALSILLSIAMLFGMMAVSGFSALTESKVYIAASADSDAKWSCNANGVLSVDRFNKIQGDASIRVDMNSTGSFSGGVFALQTFVEYENAVNLNEWDYFELLYSTEGTFNYDTVLQTNFLDGNVAGSDGFNAVNSVDKNKEDGWVRLKLKCTDVAALKPHGASPENITKMRLSFLYYSNGVYEPVDWNYDGLIYYNEDFLTDRTQAEGEMAAKLESAVVPNSENFESVKEATETLLKEYGDMREQYPNFMPTNYLKYFEIYNAYNESTKTEMVAAAKEAIDAIGEVTVDTIEEVEAAVESAQALVDELDTLYGAQNYTLENKGNIAIAQAALKECKIAATAVDGIKALPDVDSLTADDKSNVDNARKAYEMLSDTQKEYVSSDIIDILEAAEAKIKELEEKYTLGNVDEDEEKLITASDALLALQAAVGKITLSEYQQLAADVDVNGVISATDALYILQYAVNKISSFSAYAGFEVYAPEGEVYTYADHAKEFVLAGIDANASEYANGTSSPAKAVNFYWLYRIDMTEVTLEYGLKSNFSDAVKISMDLQTAEMGTLNEYGLYNLYKGSNYYWRMTATRDNGIKIVKTGSFKTTDLGPRVMVIDGLYNTRDVGGYMTEYGVTTNQGLVYRGGELWKDGSSYPHNLTEEGQKYMTEVLGIKTEIDVTGVDQEKTIPGTEVFHIKLDGYQGIYQGPDGYKEVFKVLADESNYPVYIHCTGGADRTGTVAYLLNALCGVEQRDLRLDYEFTNFSIYGERDYDTYIMIAQNYLNGLKGETLKDKAEKYLLNIGLTEEEIFNIRSIMIEDYYLYE